MFHPICRKERHLIKHHKFDMRSEIQALKRRRLQMTEKFREGRAGRVDLHEDYRCASVTQDSRLMFLLIELNEEQGELTITRLHPLIKL